MVDNGSTDDTRPPRQRYLHVGMLMRCFLCQEPLPAPNWRASSSARREEYAEWKGHLISVFPYTAADGSVQEQLRSVHLEQTRDHGVDRDSDSFWQKDPLYKKLAIDRCWNQALSGDYCHLCGIDRKLYLSHRDCWKVAFSCHRWAPLDWSRLAVQTRPFETRSNVYNERPLVYQEAPDIPILASVAEDSSLFHASTPLARLLADIRTLPAEIQIQIMDLVKGTLFASLLQARTLASEMLPRLRPSSTWTILPSVKPLQVNAEEDRSSLSCCSTSILGQSHLSELALGQLEGSASRVPIADRAVRGLQFALGRFGLRGVRISYEDGSYSSWLGESSSCWVGTVRCSDLSQLNVIADELRILRVEAAETVSSDSGPPAMWWGDGPPAFCSTRCVVLRHEIPQDPQYYPKWKQYQYLPLNFGAGYASGLTVYMGFSFSMIIRMVSHGPSDCEFGTTRFVEDEYGDATAVPIHFALSPGEYFTSAWRHFSFDRSKWNALFVVRFVPGPRTSLIPLLMNALSKQLGTNLGRFQHFGSYALPASVPVRADGESWIRLSTARPAKVHGLAIEVPKYARGRKTIGQFGVSQETSPPTDGDVTDSPPPVLVHPRGATLPSPEFTNYLRKQQKGYGFSTASLDSIATLHVRQKIVHFRTKQARGCVGLRIAHHDSTVEILGRWDPRDEDSISKIYDSSEGILTRISFCMENIERAAHVERIIVSVTDNPLEIQPLDASFVVPMDPPDPPNYSWGERPDEYPTAKTTRTFDCSQVNQRVAWWFTFEYDDIGRDHGSGAIQIKEEIDLESNREYKAVQLE